MNDFVFAQAHWDPRLISHGQTRARFLRHLLRTGIVAAIDYGSAHEEVGIFFVRKSGKDKIRLTLEARRVNQRFRRPPGVALCSTEALSRIEVELPPGVTVEICQGKRFLENLMSFLETET